MEKDRGKISWSGIVGVVGWDGGDCGGCGGDCDGGGGLVDCG